MSFFASPRRGRLFTAGAVSLLGPALAACGSSAGEAVRPTTPSAVTAMQADTADAAVTCRPRSYAEPLVVDLSATTRVDFEAAMDGGVALVNYDCKAVRLLKDCRLAGDYRFAGVSRKEEVIHLDNHDEIQANLPVSAQVKVGGGVERAAALDIAYVLVGKRTTPALVSRGVLEGSQCEEATHYIRSATVGAFAVQTSTRGRVAAAAEVFGASTSGESRSARQNARKDGNPQACEQSRPGSDAPPAECRSAIRFELVPVSDKAPVARAGKGDRGDKGDGKEPASKEVASIENPCPEGFKLVAGKCARAADAARTAHLCAPQDLEDCEAQCSVGHAGSCFNLANLAYRDYGKRVSDAETVRNEDRALALWKQACDADVFAACTQYGDNRSSKTGSQPRDMVASQQALARACSGGDAAGCYSLADQKLAGSGGTPKDPTAGMDLLGRACKLGETWACRDMGEYLFAGRYGIARNASRADALLTQFCTQGDIASCHDLGQHLLGLYEDDDRPEAPLAEIPNARSRGRALLDRTCRSGEKKTARACVVLGRILVEDNDPKGRALLSERCSADGKGDACLFLGRAMVGGKGGPVDRAAGVETLLKSADDDAMFTAAQALDRGDGVTKNPARAREILGKLCAQEEHKPSCEALKGGAPSGKGGTPASKGSALRGTTAGK
ncbi:MAG: sel1 repeat family protein [Myxococcales bacterium]|nr:MAG: sel1 repeat family protein [Myxococcales bacterium]